MVSSFLGCFSLSIIYYLVGIVYSLAAILSFAFWCLAWGEPYREWYTIILLSGNTIVFGLPALCWAIDQITPAVKYKRIFVQLYYRLKKFGYPWLWASCFRFSGVILGFWALPPMLFHATFWLTCLYFQLLPFPFQLSMLPSVSMHTSTQKKLRKQLQTSMILSLSFLKHHSD